MGTWWNQCPKGHSRKQMLKGMFVLHLDASAKCQGLGKREVISRQVFLSYKMGNYTNMYTFQNTGGIKFNSTFLLASQAAWPDKTDNPADFQRKNFNKLLSKNRPKYHCKTFLKNTQSGDWSTEQRHWVFPALSCWVGGQVSSLQALKRICLHLYFLSALFKIWSRSWISLYKSTTIFSILVQLPFGLEFVSLQITAVCSSPFPALFYIRNVTVLVCFFNLWDLFYIFTTSSKLERDNLF